VEAGTPKFGQGGFLQKLTWISPSAAGTLGLFAWQDIFPKTESPNLERD